VEAVVEGPTAPSFLKLPAKAYLFIDGKLADQREATGASVALEASPRDLGAGTHTLVVNWATENGPVAANALRFRRAADSAPSVGGR
jgi:hypothetical protein